VRESNSIRYQIPGLFSKFPINVLHSIQACNIASTKAFRDADVIITTCVGAADPRVLAACGIMENGEGNDYTNTKTSYIRNPAPDGFQAIVTPFVLIDEACQSFEPASLIPLIATSSCRSLVMFGDPCQLPPTVRSETLLPSLKSGEASPLSLSLMERLSAIFPAPIIEIRNRGSYVDVSCINTKSIKSALSMLRRQASSDDDIYHAYRDRFRGALFLSTQYRMHPSIAAFPSAVFYDKQLTTPSNLSSIRKFPTSLSSRLLCDDENMSVRLLNVKGGNNERKGNQKRFIESFGHHDSETQETGKSYWNEVEAIRVVAIIRLVLQERNCNIDSIGVVTPYSAQVRLLKGMIALDSEIQDRLRRFAVSIEVNSVDGYQGRERDLIILSTVRSNRQGFIGFLSDWRRMNVALTRARSGVVVVGDFHTLSIADKHWKAYYEWAVGAGCVIDELSEITM
jgi:superfamily I DNA and/or RNA helicase